MKAPTVPCTNTRVQEEATSCPEKQRVGLRLNVHYVFFNSDKHLIHLQPQKSQPAQSLCRQEHGALRGTQSVSSILPSSELPQQAGRLWAHFLPDHPCQPHTSKIVSGCQTQSCRHSPYHAHAAAHFPGSPQASKPKVTQRYLQLAVTLPWVFHSQKGFSSVIIILASYYFTCLPF